MEKEKIQFVTDIFLYTSYKYEKIFSKIEDILSFKRTGKNALLCLKFS
jgi:hypothetical protein